MRSRLLAGLVALTSTAACMSEQPAPSSSPAQPVEALAPRGASGWSGGGGLYGGGGSQWGGGGGLFGGGGGFWGGGTQAGGGSFWGGGGGQWGGGGGQWGGGTPWQASGGSWWGGGGGWWGGGGGYWGGGGSQWGGGGGMWGGGFASTFPFLGWSNARHWHFNGLPQQGYDPLNPSIFATATKDATACTSGQVRLGGFAYPINVEGWNGVVALGYNKKFCIPTPGSGLTMNATLGTASLTPDSLMVAGGYALPADNSRSSNNAEMLRSMIGYGNGNVATQYGGALCASIGTLAAAKRNCGVALSYTANNYNRDGSPTPRAVVVGAAQQGIVTDHNVPFGRNAGYGLYGAAPNDMESYASHAVPRYTSAAANKIPGSPSYASIDSWNDARWTNGVASSYSFTSTDFTNVGFTTTQPTATEFASVINRSWQSPLNLVPLDGISATSPDLTQSLDRHGGYFYLLNLPSLAVSQAPLFGSGAGRWFFKSPADPTKPLMDVASIYQANTAYMLTGHLSGLPTTNPTLTEAYVTQLETAYADWNGDPATGTLYIDRSGQSPATVATDADRAVRLNSALALKRPMANISLSGYSNCAITSAGGGVKCWGQNTFGYLGDGTTKSSTVPRNVVGLSSGVQMVSAGSFATCALTTGGGLKCWGSNSQGELGNGTTNNSLVPVDVPSLTSGVVQIAAGVYHMCALTAAGGVKCWGLAQEGALGRGATPYDPNNIATTPGDVVGLTSGIVAVASGSSHSCALTRAGGVKCWGNDMEGQLGDRTTGDSTGRRTSPVDAIGLTSGVVSIAAGGYHTCALLLSGQLKCWGAASRGQIGDGTSGDVNGRRLAPTVPTGFSAGAIAIATGDDTTCAINAAGAAKCWGGGAGGVYPDRFTPTQVTGLTSGVSAVQTSYNTACARLTNGGLKCWGVNAWGNVGDGTTVDRLSPVAVSTANGSVTNGSPHASQGSVLIHKETAGGTIAGHVTPIPWSMYNSATGNTSLIVTYDPLAAAAAMFIEQYDAHIAACNATPGETITQADVTAGRYLWACSNATAKTEYKAGMLTLLKGARHYLFGSDTGCLKSTQTVAGAACAATVTGPDPVHYPYTLVVPNYTTYDSGYYTSLSTAVTSYVGSLSSDTTATRLERTLQLAGIRKFDVGADAIVTNRLVRTGQAQPTVCTDNDGFATKLR